MGEHWYGNPEVSGSNLSPKFSLPFSEIVHKFPVSFSLTYLLIKLCLLYCFEIVLGLWYSVFDILGLRDLGSDSSPMYLDSAPKVLRELDSSTEGHPHGSR